VILDGKREIACHTRDLGEAEKILARHLAGTIGDLIDAYLKRETATTYNKHISKAVRKWWGDKLPAEVSPKTCAGYTEHRSQSVKLSTIRHELIFLGSCLSWCDGVGKKAQVVGLVLPPKPNPRDGYFLTRNQIAARLRIARRSPYHKHLIRLILICIYTGTRPGAALGLSWLPSPTGWFDLQAGILHRGPDCGNKKRGSCRIHDRLLVHLRRWRRMDLKAGIASCVHRRGQPLKKVNKAWNWVAKKAGQRDGPHICRHTCATWLMQSGVSYHEASGFLSMSADTLERHYAHHRPDFQQAAARARGR
jgi:integrase